MLNDILLDYVSITDAETQIYFDKSFDYSEQEEKHKNAIDAWKEMSTEKRSEYNSDLNDYLKTLNLANIKSPEYIPAKNWSILKKEISARVKDQNILNLLMVSELHFEQSLLEIVENVENADHIRELYRLRKRTTGSTKNSGISIDEAVRIKNCLRQGRELYLSGKNGSLMVKPLNFFYSMTAYAYGIIILNNPLRYSLDNLPGSHGLNYLPTDIKAQFGGDMAKGTFTDLFSSYATTIIKNKNIEIIQDNSESIYNFYKKKISTTAGTLLSMVPEIREYYSLVTGTQSRTYPVEIINGRSQRQIVWEFHIGDGENRPNLLEVEKSFNGFLISERYGKVVVEVSASQAHKLQATIYTDSKGDFWYIENPFHPIILPEECLHFILTNAFSNIMRYSPDKWGSILLNEGNSGVSLITRKYLSAFENKFPILALRSISRFFPFVSTNN